MRVTLSFDLFHFYYKLVYGSEFFIFKIIC